MILVFISSLALAAFDQIGRLTPLDFQRMREGAPLFVPFLIMVALKLGLAVGLRARRRRSDEVANPLPPDEAIP
jgi:hypothetical protein